MKRLLIVLAVGAALGVFCPAAIASAPSSSLSLQQQKLQEEIKQLQLSNQGQEGIGGFVRAYGGILTGLAAVLGTLGALLEIMPRSGGASARPIGTSVRKKARQRQLDAARQADEAFAGVIAGLGSTQPFKRVGAAVGLWTFVEPAYTKYWPQIYRITLANLNSAGTMRRPGNSFICSQRSSLLQAPDKVDTDLFACVSRASRSQWPQRAEGHYGRAEKREGRAENPEGFLTSRLPTSATPT